MGATGIMGGLHGEAPTAFLIRELTFTDDTRTRTILATRTRPGRDYRHVLYAAARFTDTATGEDIVEALVIQYETIRRNGRHEFVYRVESEHVGPCPCDCPAAILALLSPLPDAPTDGSPDPHANARQWRAACRPTTQTRAPLPPAPAIPARQAQFSLF